MSSFYSFSQEEKNDEKKTQEEKNTSKKTVVEDKKFDWNKIRFGGTLGAYFGDVTYVDLSPTFSYPLRENWEAGAGPVFRYLLFKDWIVYSNGRSEDLEMTTYGGKLLTRYFIYEGLFAQAEAEIISFNYINYYNYKRYRATDIFPLVGGGYAQMTSSRSYFYILILFNLNESAYAPYPSNPIIRIGISF